MKLILRDDRIEAVASFHEKDIVKGAGFRFDWDNKVWWTGSLVNACKLIEFADETLRPKLEAFLKEREAVIEASRATDADVNIPSPDGLDYLPYQRAGIAFAMRTPNVLIGDEMGLGKTIQALGLINALDASVSRVLIVCPASLRLNWKREAERWLTREMSVGIANTKDGLPDTDIVIINYDILKKVLCTSVSDGRTMSGKKLVQKADIPEFDLLIGDEVHYAKNRKAQRSQAFYAVKAKRRVYLTGTPITNRPMELFPIVSSLDPETFPSFWSYAQRYCGAYNNGWGWDFKGATNLEELQDKLRSTVMVRRLKADVLTELPAKRRQVIEVEVDAMTNKYVQAEKERQAKWREEIAKMRAQVELAKASDDPADYENAVTRLRDARQVQFTEMARLRHATALAKVPYVISHIRDLIEDDETYKVVVMAHHHDVIDLIKEAFGDKAVVLTGAVALEARQEAVDAFQTDPKVQVFIGGIQSAGVGITLTASSHVVFAELDWVPANMAQAEDRVHRIGQTNSVLIQHIVVDGSIDAGMAQTLVEKMNVIDKALDKEHDVDTVGILTTDEAETLQREAQEAQEASDAEWATRKASRDALAKEAVDITPVEIDIVHKKLKYLASVCDGAHARDGMGFNGVDTRIGKSLAYEERLTPKQAVLGRKIVQKYKNQLTF